MNISIFPSIEEKMHLTLRYTLTYIFLLDLCYLDIRRCYFRLFSRDALSILRNCETAMSKHVNSLIIV